MTKFWCNTQVVRQKTTMTKTPPRIYVGNPLGWFRHFPIRLDQTPHFSSLRTLRSSERSLGEAPTRPAQGKYE